MYNHLKVIELFEKRGIRRKDLMEYLGKNYAGSLEQLVQGDIRASKLEKIADFLCVPIDTFFDREDSNYGVNIGGVKSHVHDFQINNATKSMEALIEEKDKRIQLLEDMVSMLKAQLKDRQVGQNSDNN